MNGPDLLRTFMRAFGLKPRHVAEAIDVTTQAVHYWLVAGDPDVSGSDRIPRARQRKAIAKWTTVRDPVTGVERTWVPEDAWETEEDRAYLASIQPFEVGSLREAA